jgi:hypothetical protein
VKVSGYVNCDPSLADHLADHAKVINGASDFLVEVFGEKENTPGCQLGQVAWLLIAQLK